MAIKSNLFRTFENPKRIFQFISFYWLAVATALFIWSRDWEIVRYGAVKQYEDLFGIFAFCVFCSLTSILYLELKTYKTLSNEILILIGLPYLTSLFFLAQITELSTPSWDYKQYEAAFRAISDGTNPYLSNRYLYPPVFADMMVFVYRVGLRVFPLLSIGKSEWIFVFYIHQASLLFFLLLSYFLSIKFAKQIGLKNLPSVILVSVIFIFNVPILRTISFNQVNFYVLASILIILVFLQEYPFLAGIFTAFGGLIKLYPFALSIPLFFMKKWKALVGIFTGIFVIVFFETNFFSDFEIWKQFYAFYISFPIKQESLLFRNSSPVSFIRSTFTFLGLSANFISIGSSLVILIILIWFAFRFYQREKLDLSPFQLSMNPDQLRATGHLLDFSVISLLIAPSAWEHHYVVVIPLAIWAFAMRSKYISVPIAIAFILVFALPVYNIYPFSYFRLIGTLWFLILISPNQIKNSPADLSNS